MAEPETRFVTCAHPGGLHRMAYHVWSPGAAGSSPGAAEPTGRTVLCVHGLTRNGRDFDPLARRLVEDGHEVVCPDIVGRGRSERLPHGASYSVPQYVADCVTLVARLGIDRVDWVGTSMGGLIGMLLASLPGNPIERLLLNDIGPEIDTQGLERIRGYIGDSRRYPDFDSAERALRSSMRSFGPHTDSEFRVLSEHYFVHHEDGSWRAHYDPAIAEPILAGGSGGAGKPALLWSAWDAIRCPVTVLRGAESDLLSAATYAAMATRGPAFSGAVFEGVGHAPTLIVDDQAAAVQRFLDAA